MFGLNRILRAVKLAGRRVTASSNQKTGKGGVHITAILDCEVDRNTVKEVAADSGWNVQFAPSMGQSLWGTQKPCRTLLIYDSERSDWREVIAQTSSAMPAACVLLASEVFDQRLWSEVIRLGGRDLIRKPIQKQELQKAIDFALNWQEWSSSHDTMERVPVKIS
jgi:hypothetical protein